HLIANFVWNRVRREQRPRLLVIDEAWSLLRYAEGGEFVSAMARRARKYYLGLVTITQDVADFVRSDHGRAVLVNASMKLLLKQDSTTVEAVAEAFQLTPEEREYVLGANKGEGLLFARGARLPITIEARSAEHVSVEMAADCSRRRFLVRTSTKRMRDQLLSQLGAAYPQANLRPVPDGDDPARFAVDERSGACTLVLRAPPYLPVRTFTDLD